MGFAEAYEVRLYFFLVLFSLFLVGIARTYLSLVTQYGAHVVVTVYGSGWLVPALSKKVWAWFLVRSAYSFASLMNPSPIDD